MQLFMSNPSSSIGTYIKYLQNSTYSILRSLEFEIGKASRSINLARSTLLYNPLHAKICSFSLGHACDCQEQVPSMY